MNHDDCPACTQNGHPGDVETIENGDQSRFVKCGLCKGDGSISYDRALEIINDNYIKIDVDNGN